jgi:hypothetical protein
MIKLFFYFLDKVVSWYKLQKDRFELERQAALTHELTDVDIPLREQAVACKQEAQEMRDFGTIYYDATMKFLTACPDKNISDFDQLDALTKAQYFA